MAKSGKRVGSPAKARKGRGRAVTIGLNSVDPKHYAGWAGELIACEADAADMADIARSQGFTVRSLLTRRAKRAAVLREIRAAAKALESGDLFMLTYSGHGGQLPDQNGDEDDLQDETWCLYDGELLDDELMEQWVTFKPGVRILVFSDSCHSGTAVRANYRALAASGALATVMDKVPLPRTGDDVLGRFRAMPPPVAVRTYRKNKEFYDHLGKRKVSDGGVRASILLISGCQDNQLSGDGDFNGVFTGRLKIVWNEGAFNGSYRQFHKSVLKGMPATQSPNFFTVGAANSTYLNQKPFTI
jgi:hypothetical protein